LSVCLSVCVCVALRFSGERFHSIFLLCICDPFPTEKRRRQKRRRRSRRQSRRPMTQDHHPSLANILTRNPSKITSNFQLRFLIRNNRKRGAAKQQQHGRNHPGELPFSIAPEKKGRRP
jgi:hypothetical protein